LKESEKTRKAPPPAPEPYYCYEDDEIDLYELWLVLKKRKAIIIATTFLFTVLAIVYAFFIAKPVYRTEATLVPLQQENRVSSLLSSLPISFPIPTSPGTISVETVLNSRTLKERLIKELNLKPLLFPNSWDSKLGKWKEEEPTLQSAAKALDKLMNVSQDKKTGVLKFTVDFPENPEMAYKIAVKSLEIAREILSEKNAELAHIYASYLKEQLEKVKQKYKLLEKLYRDFLEGKIKEVPFIFDESELKILEEIEKTPSETGKKYNSKSFRSLPDYKFNLERLKFQMEIASKLLAGLSQQYEIAKAKEEKSKLAFQVIDPPYIPDFPYKPKKKLILAVAVISGLFIGIFLAFFKEWIDNIKRRETDKGSSENEA